MEQNNTPSLVLGGVGVATEKKRAPELRADTLIKRARALALKNTLVLSVFVTEIIMAVGSVEAFQTGYCDDGVTLLFTES